MVCLWSSGCLGLGWACGIRSKNRGRLAAPFSTPGTCIAEIIPEEQTSQHVGPYSNHSSPSLPPLHCHNDKVLLHLFKRAPKLLLLQLSEVTPRLQLMHPQSPAIHSTVLETTGGHTPLRNQTKFPPMVTEKPCLSTLRHHSTSPRIHATTPYQP